MGKNKKKHSKKDKVSEDILDAAALTLKKFRKVTREIGKLSTGQKIVGGLALAAAGLTYLASQQTEAAEPEPGSHAAPRLLKASSHHHATTDAYEDASGESEGPVVPPRKSRKSTRAK